MSLECFACAYQHGNTLGLSAPPGARAGRLSQASAGPRRVAGMTALTGPRDEERLKRDLLAAGYKGEKVALIVPTDFPNLKALSDVGADMLRRIGMNVDYQAMDSGR